MRMTITMIIMMTEAEEDRNRRKQEGLREENEGRRDTCGSTGCCFAKEEEMKPEKERKTRRIGRDSVSPSCPCA